MKKTLDTNIFFSYIVGMKDIILAIIAISLITISTDVIEWISDKIQKRFNKYE